MSRLWPETFRAGLFPGQCWLQRGRVVKAVACDISRDPQVLLEALGVMLANEGNTLRSGGKADVMVSDGIAAIALLPWQEQLHRPAELERYAIACFDKLGMKIDDTWIMHVEFPRYREAGLAYAVPRAWLVSLIELLEGKGMRLRTIMPVTAAAFYSKTGRPRDDKTLALLCEAGHVAALMQGREGLCGYDVEPVTGSAHDAAGRLLNRVAVHHDNLKRVSLWSPMPPEQSISAEFVTTRLPGVTVQTLERNTWNG